MRGPTVLMLVLAAVGRAGWGDEVTFRWNGGVQVVQGNVLAEDAAGTILLQGRDLQHFVISAADLMERKAGGEVAPFAPKELRAAVEKEFGKGFGIYQTKHYLIVHSCPAADAKKVGELFERVYKVFITYFKAKKRGGFELVEPKQPLVAVVCANREEYIRIVEPELGPLAAQTAGVYMPMNNRMFMYNALGGKAGALLELVGQQNRGAAQELHKDLLWQTLSTVIHEGVHQIAYNSGFHNRQGHNPLWLVEGMAMFFEAPIPQQRGGFRLEPGSPNPERSDRLAKLLPRRRTDSLRRLVLDDTYLRDPKTALDGYAESWAFTYFLTRKEREAYGEYLRRINARPTMVEYTPEERLADFRAAFGKAPEEFEDEFVRYMRSFVVAARP